MDVQELQKQIGALTEKLKAAQAENEALKGKLAEADKGKGEADKGKKDAEEKASKTAADFAAFQAKIAGDARAARIRALVDSGKLEPAREAETLSFAAALALVAEPVNFSAEGGKPEQVSAEERYFRELEARPVDPRFNVNFAAPAPAHAAGAKTEQYVTVTDKL